MIPYLFEAILVVLAIGAGILFYVVIIGALQVSGLSKSSYFHFSSYITMFAAACLTFFSGRSLNTAISGTVQLEEATRSPLLGLTIQITSAMILFVSLDKIVKFYRREGKVFGNLPLLTLAFIAYWLGSVASPMLFSSHPYFHHFHIYPLIIGVAGLMTIDRERDLFVASTRNALHLFLFLGYLFFLYRPDMAADLSYSQGLIPGLPRFAGLAPHAIVLGGLAQVAMLTLLLVPFKENRLNMLAWALCGVTLLLAQSKTTWVSTIFIAVTLYMIRNREQLQSRIWDRRYNSVFIMVLVAAMLFATVAAANVMFGNAGNKISNFLASGEGAQITSLTGRDQIWDLAISRWLSNQVFGDGEGPSLGLSVAVHGHNQLVDTLWHSGLAGGIPLVIYFVLLGFYSIRYSAISGGVTLGIFLMIAFRSVSEIPLSITGYGTEFIAQLLLIVLLSSYFCSTITRKQQAPKY